MRIAVVGTGAMGSVYAGLLADAGNEVWAVDVWREHIEAIKEKGLRVEGASGDRRVWMKATTIPSEIGLVDLVIIATKTSHVQSAAESIRTLVGNHTTVLTIQNGLGSGETVTTILGQGKVILGVAGGFGASIKAPGHVHHNGWEFVHMGEPHGPATPRVHQVAEIWRRAGFKVTAQDDLKRLIWEKLICNVCYSGICAVLECTIGEVITDCNAWKVGSTCAVEAFQVALRSGVHLSFKDPIQHVQVFGRKIPKARPSVLLDLMAGRPTEIGEINGAIPRAASLYDYSAPYNEVITALVKNKEKQSKL